MSSGSGGAQGVLDEPSPETLRTVYQEISDCVLLRRRGEAIETRLNLQDGALSQFADRPRGRLRGLADEIGAGWIIYNAVMAAWLFVACYGLLGIGGVLGMRRNIWVAPPAAALACVFVGVVALSLRKGSAKAPTARESVQKRNSSSNEG